MILLGLLFWFISNFVPFYPNFTLSFSFLQNYFSYPVLSHFIVCYSVLILLYYYILSCPFLCYPMIFYYMLFCFILLYSILSYPVMYYSVLPRFILFSCILFYPIIFICSLSLQVSFLALRLHVDYETFAIHATLPRCGIFSCLISNWLLKFSPMQVFISNRSFCVFFVAVKMYLILAQLRVLCVNGCRFVMVSCTLWYGPCRVVK